MSEFAVERARQMFQARSRRGEPAGRTGQAGQGQPAARRARTGAEQATAEAGTTPGRTAEVIGALHLMHSRLRRLDGWLRDEHQLNLTEMHVLSRIPGGGPSVQRGIAGGDRAAALAKAVGLSPSGLTRLVDRLVERGLLARVDDAWDGRVTHLVLTERGRAVRDAVLPRAVDQIQGSCEQDRGLLEQLGHTAAGPADRPWWQGRDTP